MNVSPESRGPNKLFSTVATIVCLSFLTVTSAYAEREFDAEDMLSELESQLDLSSDKLSKLKPALDAKSAELKKSIDDTVERGFMQFGALTDQLDAASKEAEAQLREALSSDEMKQLTNYLNSIDQDAIAAIRDELVAKATEFLKLTEDQLQQLKPAIEDGFDRLGEMLDELTKEGGRNIEEFTRRYEQLSEELNKKLEQTLDSKQLESLDTHREEIRESIERALFST